MPMSSTISHQSQMNLGPVNGWGGAGGYGASRFDNVESFGSSYSTPGWQRAQANRKRGGQARGGFGALRPALQLAFGKAGWLAQRCQAVPVGI